MSLSGTLVCPSALTRGQRDDMFALMKRCYAGLEKRRFLADLVSKSGTILLTDASRRIRGFSTYRIDLHRDLDVLVLFSGDTVVDPDSWGGTALFSQFARLIRLLSDYCDERRTPLPPELRVFGVEAAGTRPRRAYWFLISKGYRTYLMLPLFFRSYYPGLGDRSDPALAPVLHRLSRDAFGTAWQPECGTIAARADRLKGELAETPRRRRENPHVRFFLERNPRYREGVELACLTELSRENLMPGARRWITRP